MSRSKTVDEPVKEEPIAELNVDIVEKGTVAIAAKGVRKMGVEYFLQKHPQPQAIAIILRSKYKKATMTEAEWLKVVDDLSNKKIVN